MTRGTGHRDTATGAPRRGRILSVVAAVLLIGGSAAVTVGLLDQETAPQAAAAPAATAPASPSPGPTAGSPPPAPNSGTASSAPAARRIGSPAAPSARTGSTSVPAPAPAADPPGAARSDTAAAPKAAVPAPTRPIAAPAVAAALPVAVRIPSIGVDSDLIRLGLNPDGTLGVPQPGPDYDKAGWFTGSPAPGSIGPAVIEGHIDSAANGPSVFFELGAVAAGDEIEVDRADGSTVRFVVDKVTSYPKDQFPTLEVYGNTAGPELRVITCGGDFDSAKGSYRDNTVVYAHLKA